MSKLLFDEAPLVLSPSLAAWIGLNESIFLQQLHYQLTENKNVGRVADNIKWYRDTPRAFVVKFFPFWDENVVKRTIANLRKDGLLLARSDLNTDRKDRSLWYTVNYPAVERLQGPVERLIKKVEKRKAARLSRQDVDSNEYTKVQNVLLQTEVQNVSDLESTKCTDAPGTKCTDAQVQNVPTPKELLPKESLPKESPKGGDKSPAPKPKTELMNHFLDQSGLKMPTRKSDVRFWWSSIAEIYNLVDHDVGQGKNLITKVIKYMRADNLTIGKPESIINICRAELAGTNGRHHDKRRAKNVGSDEQATVRASAIPRTDRLDQARAAV